MKCPNCNDESARQYDADSISCAACGKVFTKKDGLYVYDAAKSKEREELIASKNEKKEAVKNGEKTFDLAEGWGEPEGSQAAG